MTYAQKEKSLSGYGEIMPLDVDVLRGLEHCKKESTDIHYEHTTNQSSDVMSLKNFNSFTENSNTFCNKTKLAAYIISDYSQNIINDSCQDRKSYHEEKKQAFKQNKTTKSEKLQHREELMLPKTNENREGKEKISADIIPSSQPNKRRRRKKKRKTVAQHSAVKVEKRDQISNDKTFNVYTVYCWTSRVMPALKLSVVAYILFLSFVTCSGTQQSATVRWTLMNRTIIFGEPVLLHCRMKGVISSCHNTSTRRWTKGKSQSPLVYDGTSSDVQKYKEKIDKDCSGSILYILNFHADDFDAYTCGTEFTEYTDTIHQEQNSYRSYPDLNKLMTEMQCENKKLLVKFNLVDFYPMATCTFYTKDRNGTLHNYSEGTRRNPLSRLLREYILNYRLRDDICKDEIQVYCSIDGMIIDIINRTYDCCKDFQHLDDHEDDISSIFVVVGVLLLAFGVVIFLLLKRKAIHEGIASTYGRICSNNQHNEEYDSIATMLPKENIAKENVDAEVKIVIDSNLPNQKHSNGHLNQTEEEFVCEV